MVAAAARRAAAEEEGKARARRAQREVEAEEARARQQLAGRRKELSRLKGEKQMAHRRRFALALTVCPHCLNRQACSSSAPDTSSATTASNHQASFATAVPMHTPSDSSAPHLGACACSLGRVVAARYRVAARQG